MPEPHRASEPRPGSLEVPKAIRASRRDTHCAAAPTAATLPADSSLRAAVGGGVHVDTTTPHVMRSCGVSGDLREVKLSRIRRQADVSQQLTFSDHRAHPIISLLGHLIDCLHACLALARRRPRAPHFFVMSYSDHGSDSDGSPPPAEPARSFQ